MSSMTNMLSCDHEAGADRTPDLHLCWPGHDTRRWLSWADRLRLPAEQVAECCSFHVLLLMAVCCLGHPNLNGKCKPIFKKSSVWPGITSYTSSMNTALNMHLQQPHIVGHLSPGLARE